MCRGVCVQGCVCRVCVQEGCVQEGCVQGVCAGGVCAGCVCRVCVQGEGVHWAGRAGGTHFSPTAQAREQLTSQCSLGKGGNVWPVCTGAELGLQTLLHLL